MDLVLVSVEKIVVSDDEERVIKVIVEQLQTADGIVKGGDVDGGSNMVPVTAKDACLNITFFALFDHPLDKPFTRIVMVSAVVSHPIMDITKNGYLREIEVFLHIRHAL
jgi:hypothetical protein